MGRHCMGGSGNLAGAVDVRRASVSGGVVSIGGDKYETIMGADS